MVLEYKAMRGLHGTDMPYISKQIEWLHIAIEQYIAGSVECHVAGNGYQQDDMERAFNWSRLEAGFLDCYLFNNDPIDLIHHSALLELIKRKTAIATDLGWRHSSIHQTFCFLFHCQSHIGQATLNGNR